MRSNPFLQEHVKLQHAVPRRTMAGLTDKPEQQAVTATIGHGKADGIA